MTEPVDALWVEMREEWSITHLARVSGLSESELSTLVELGALTPEHPEGGEWRFDARCMTSLRTAGRLRRAFDLDADALALTLSLVERIQELQDELRRLRAVVPERMR